MSLTIMLHPALMKGGSSIEQLSTVLWHSLHRVSDRTPQPFAMLPSYSILIRLKLASLGIRGIFIL